MGQDDFEAEALRKPITVFLAHFICFRRTEVQINDLDFFKAVCLWLERDLQGFLSSYASGRLECYRNGASEGITGFGNVYRLEEEGCFGEVAWRYCLVATIILNLEDDISTIIGETMLRYNRRVELNFPETFDWVRVNFLYLHTALPHDRRGGRGVHGRAIRR